MKQTVCLLLCLVLLTSCFSAKEEAQGVSGEAAGEVELPLCIDFTDWYIGKDEGEVEEFHFTAIFESEARYQLSGWTAWETMTLLEEAELTLSDGTSAELPIDYPFQLGFSGGHTLEFSAEGVHWMGGLYVPQNKSSLEYLLNLTELGSRKILALGDLVPFAPEDIDHIVTGEGKTKIKIYSEMDIGRFYDQFKVTAISVMEKVPAANMLRMEYLELVKRNGEQIQIGHGISYGKYPVVEIPDGNGGTVLYYSHGRVFDLDLVYCEPPGLTLIIGEEAPSRYEAKLITCDYADNLWYENRTIADVESDKVIGFYSAVPEGIYSLEYVDHLGEIVKPDSVQALVYDVDVPLSPGNSKPVAVKNLALDLPMDSGKYVLEINAAFAEGTVIHLLSYAVDYKDDQQELLTKLSIRDTDVYYQPVEATVQTLFPYPQDAAYVIGMVGGNLLFSTWKELLLYDLNGVELKRIPYAQLVHHDRDSFTITQPGNTDQAVTFDGSGSEIAEDQPDIGEGPASTVESIFSSGSYDSMFISGSTNNHINDDLYTLSSLTSTGSELYHYSQKKNAGRVGEFPVMECVAIGLESEDSMIIRQHISGVAIVSRVTLGNPVRDFNPVDNRLSQDILDDYIGQRLLPLNYGAPPIYPFAIMTHMVKDYVKAFREIGYRMDIDDPLIRERVISVASTHCYEAKSGIPAIKHGDEYYSEKDLMEQTIAAMFPADIADLDFTESQRYNADAQGYSRSGGYYFDTTIWITKAVNDNGLLDLEVAVTIPESDEIEYVRMVIEYDSENLIWSYRSVERIG